MIETKNILCFSQQLDEKKILKWKKCIIIIIIAIIRHKSLRYTRIECEREMQFPAQFRNGTRS
jgi:hypothetical protein